MSKRVWLAMQAVRYLYETQSSFRRLLIKAGLGVALIVALLKASKTLRRLVMRLYSKKQQSKAVSLPADRKRLVNPSLNRQFVAELSYLLRLMFPRCVCRQTVLLAVHTLTLTCRTFLSIYVARLEGLLVRNVVEKNLELFILRLIQWLLIALPATTCNSLIRYLESKLDLELKAQLVKK